MTPQALAAAGTAAAALVCAAALITYLVTQLRDARRDRDGALAARQPLEADRDDLRRRLAFAEGAEQSSHAAMADARAELAAVRDELARERESPLAGKVVVVNTPRPDDQSIRGVVTKELDDGGIVLTAAVLFETVPGRGDSDGEVIERPAGDVVIRRVSWVQQLPAPEA